MVRFRLLATTAVLVLIASITFGPTPSAEAQYHTSCDGGYFDYWVSEGYAITQSSWSARCNKVTVRGIHSGGHTKFATSQNHYTSVSSGHYDIYCYNTGCVTGDFGRGPFHRADHYAIANPWPHSGHAPSASSVSWVYA